MSGQYYVYSTLTGANLYQNHLPMKDGEGNNLPVPDGEGILIEGGAGVASKNLITPRGVVSGPFDESQITYLQANPVFQLHEKNGFVTIDNRKLDPDVVAADLVGRDKSAPLVDADFPDDANGESTAPKAADSKPSRRK